MKKLIPILLLLASCAKVPQDQSNYLVGTWYNTAHIDTVFTDTGKVVTQLPAMPAIEFTVNTAVCTPYRQDYYTNVLNFQYPFSLVKIDNTHIKLDYKYNNLEIVEYYMK